LISASFDESTGYLDRPPSMTADECDPLAVARVQYSDGIPAVVSCWKLTAEEVGEFKRTGRIWLIVTGQSMPPVALTANKPF